MQEIFEENTQEILQSTAFYKIFVSTKQQQKNKQTCKPKTMFSYFLFSNEVTYQSPEVANHFTPLVSPLRGMGDGKMSSGQRS